ncbi:MAG: biotin--[acetyl-CoA-carboxylase] ligase [Acidimicrobiaceae bacterium]|nr:biotin--[acetyl-CoA-carboxylase] ligase [Acidimicrobiaceae bacterium]
MEGPSHHLGPGPSSQGVSPPGPFRVEVVEVTGSTNSDLVQRAHAGEPAGLVLRTEHQTAGRGRLDRAWEAPSGANLLFSVLLRPDWPSGRVPLVTSALAVSLTAVLEGPLADLGLAPAVKWPNDVVLVDSAGSTVGKVAGILAELVDADPPSVVVGMGVNVGWPEAGDGPPGAVSLRTAGLDAEVDGVLPLVLDAFGIWCEVLGGDDGDGRLRVEHLRRSATVGRRVSVELADGPMEAVAVDIALDGGLVLDVEGQLVEVRAGDVVHLRADVPD